MDRTRGYTCRHAIDSVYEIKSLQSKNEYAVNLTKSTCTCFTFQSQGFPCAHAFKAILYERGNIAQYVEEWCTVAAYRKTYEKGILPPIASPNLETIPVFNGEEDRGSDLSSIAEDLEYNSEEEADLLPPNTRRPTGRPKKRRLRHGIEKEPQREFKCGRCSGVGHNKRTCREPLISVAVD
jgi:zinc finger SWIM domain-containing protein 3